MIKIGKTEKYIHEMLEKQGKLLFCSIDPLDYKNEEDAVKTAKAVNEGGADIVFIGGSTGAQGELLDRVATGIKEAIDVPLVLFPGNLATITRHADALLLLSVLNARNPYYITQVQTLAAPTLKMLNIEPLPTGYIVVQPGGTVGWVSDANLVPREKPKIAAALALAGQYQGNRFIYTDTGSNPRLQGFGPIPKEMIMAVRSAIDIPYIVGGGIISVEELKTAYAAGADIVKIGTAFQNSPEEAKKKATLFKQTCIEEGKKKLKH